MDFRKDKEVVAWAKAGAKPLGRSLKKWEVNALKKHLSLLRREAAVLRNLAASGTASESMVKMRLAAAEKYEARAEDFAKLTKRFNIYEGVDGDTKMKITKSQLRQIIQEEKQKLLNENAALDTLLDDFVIDLADQFRVDMLAFSKEPGNVSDYRAFNEEAYRAAEGMEELVIKAVRRIVRGVEEKLINGDYAR